MGSEALNQLMALLAAGGVDASTPVEQLRVGYDLLAGLATVADVTTEVVDLDGVAAERHVPAGANEARAVVHLHGGGYVIGSPSTHRPLASHLAVATGCPVLVPDYRLAPEHPLPAALDDASAAWVALAATLEPGRLALSGDSAGGGLALLLAQQLRATGGPAPSALALQSPWVDLRGGARSLEARRDRDVLLSPELLATWSTMARGELAADDPRCSPLLGDLGGLPPMLVHVGGAEVLHDDATALVAGVRDAGGTAELVEADELPHVWPFFAGNLPEADATLLEIGAFLRSWVA